MLVRRHEKHVFSIGGTESEGKGLGGSRRFRATAFLARACIETKEQGQMDDDQVFGSQKLTRANSLESPPPSLVDMAAAAAAAVVEVEVALADQGQSYMAQPGPGLPGCSNVRYSFRPSMGRVVLRHATRVGGRFGVIQCRAPHAFCASR